MSPVSRQTAHGVFMTTTMNRTDITLLRRRAHALGHRNTQAGSVATGTSIAAGIIGMFAVAWLFTGHMGQFEPLRLFVIFFTAVLVVVAIAASTISYLSRAALNRVEETLIRAGAHALPDPVYYRGRDELVY